MQLELGPMNPELKLYRNQIGDMITKKNIKITVAIISTLFLVSCGIWGDFTTYFNRYYNAEKLFEEVQTELNKNQKNIFNYQDKKITSQIKSKLKKVVEKTSKIFQFNKESSYFPDALFITGKAFYIQQEYSKALRKFQELAALNNEDYNLISLVWIGKCQLKLRDFDTGLNTLDKAIEIAKKEEDDEALQEAFISEISFLSYREKYADAINKCNLFLKVSDDDELNAKTAYQLGQLNLKMDNLEQAAKAFTQVDNYSPDFTTEFNSKLEIAKIYKKLGKTGKSLELLKQLKNANRYKDYWDFVDLEIGQIYYNKGNIKDALSEYLRIDTTYSKKESGGIASYFIGNILANDYHDYDSALGYFQKTISSKAPFEYRNNASNELVVIKKYLKMNSKLDKYYTQLIYLTNEDAFMQDSIAYEESVKKDTLNNKKKIKPKESIKKPKVKFVKSNKPAKPIRPKISADSVLSLMSNTEFDLANLFLTELNLPDSASYYYSKSLEDNPNNPDKPQILFAMGGYFLNKGDTLKADSLYEYIYDNYKGNEIVNQAAKKLNLPEIAKETVPAEKSYLKAESSFLDSNYEDAISKLYNIYRKYPKSTYAAKSLYAIGYIYENKLSKMDSAAAVYDSLNKHFRNSDYAKKIKAKLLFYRKEQKAREDSIKAALKASQDSVKASLKTVQDSVKQLHRPALKDSLKVKEDLKIKKHKNLKKQLEK